MNAISSSLDYYLYLSSSSIKNMDVMILFLVLCYEDSKIVGRSNCFLLASPCTIFSPAFSSAWPTDERSCSRKCPAQQPSTRPGIHSFE